MMKSQIQNCDVAVIPYNYVIDKDLRQQTNIPFENSVIIFDEGHNINQSCEDMFTFELSLESLA
jgi:regulator of telomere elongation helicase 1